VTFTPTGDDATAFRPDDGRVWFSVRARFVIAAVALAAIAVAIGLLAGDWAPAAVVALLIVVSAIRVWRLRRDDADRYSTPGPWGTPPPQ
jgi:hypothetical protein